MKEFSCTKCKSKNVYINTVGTQTGLYCSDCGKWIKWLDKEERRLAEKYIDSIEQKPLKEESIKDLIIILLDDLSETELSKLYLTLTKRGEN